MGSGQIRTAHLWKHQNGTYYAVWREEGQPKRRSLRTKQKVRAERELARLKAAERPGQSNADLTVAAACDRWLQEKYRPMHGISQRTLNEYALFTRRVKEFWPREDLLDSVHVEQVYDWLEFLERRFRLSPQTLRKQLALLRQMFNWHLDLGNMNRNPARPVKFRGETPKRTDAMLEDEYLELVRDVREWAGETAKEDDQFYRLLLADLIDVLAHSGLRSIEAFRLNWDDIDLRQRVWTIRSPRNKGGVKVLPMHSTVVEVVSRLQDASLIGDGPFDAFNPLQNRWKRFKKERERWRHTSFHSLRHGFVTRLVKQGLRWQAQQLAGHHTERMTDHYTHLQAEDLRNALEGI